MKRARWFLDIVAPFKLVFVLIRSVSTSRSFWNAFAPALLIKSISTSISSRSISKAANTLVGLFSFMTRSSVSLRYYVRLMAQYISNTPCSYGAPQTMKLLALFQENKEKRGGGGHGRVAARTPSP